MKKIFLCLLLTLINSLAFSQQTSDWKNYTDMKSVNSIFVEGSSTWAATNGGAFYFNLQDSTFLLLRRAEGLSSTIITSVATDKNNKVWFGSSSGIINVYDPASKEVQSILDIYNSDRSSKTINNIFITGDTVIVSTDFGISLIDINNFFFYDTYFRFGNLPSNIKVNSANKLNNQIYANTDFGLAVQKAGVINLSAPESWDVYTTTNELPSSKTKKVLLYKDSLVVSTDKGLAVKTDGSWKEFLPEFNDADITDIIAFNDSLAVLSENKITVYSTGKTALIFSSSDTHTALAHSNEQGLVIASSRGIKRLNSQNIAEVYFPNGPERNQFPDMTVDPKGILWCASGKDGAGVGIYRFDGENWSVTNKSNYPQLNTNDLYRIYSAPDNSIYVGSWGHGFAKFIDTTLQVFDFYNTEMKGISTDQDFLVITGFDYDSQNNLWVLNYASADKKSLNLLTQDSIWYYYSVPSENNLYTEQHFGLVIDNYDTKWYYSLDPNRTGLFYFNENKTFDNLADDKSGYLTEANGLNSSTVLSIVIDKRGDVWAGTNLGINIITNNGTILSQSSPSFNISSVFSLRQQTINAIAVDALNQKWVGTNEGLFLVNSDGSFLIDSYNTKNSPLLSDIVRSIAIDEVTGTVYVGSDAGLTSFITPSIKPLDTFNELFFFPNPFILGSGNNLLTIDGLIKDTEIKILTVDGKLVNNFLSPGGRVAYWDGKDNQGRLVNSGVYLIVAYDQEGNSILTGKVAVLRE